MTNETDYETRKTARCNRIARDPLCAIADFVRWHTKRGFTFTIESTDTDGDNDCLCSPRTKRVIEIIRAVYEIEIATFSIIGPDGNADGRWVTFMFPSSLNCSPEESVADFGMNAVSDAWSEDFYKRCDAHR